MPVPAPGGKGNIAGTLTRSEAEGETELLTVRIGKDAPKVLRLAVLVDNIGSADYVARTVTLALNGEACRFPSLATQRISRLAFLGSARSP